MIIPKDLQPFFRKKEIRYSLKTGYLGTAKSKARLLAGLTQQTFREIREIINMGDLTGEQIQEMVNRFFRGFLDLFEDLRVEMGGDPQKMDNIDHLVKIFHGVCRRSQAQLRECNYSGMKGFVDPMLKIEGIEVEEATPLFNKISREYLKAMIKFGQIDENRHNGIYSDDVRVPFPLPSDNNTKMQPPAEPKEDNSITLEELINEFQKGKIESRNWSVNTARNHQAKINFLLQALGNRPVNLITVEDLRILAKLLELLPPGFSRLKAYENISGLSPNELEGKHEVTMDITTRRAYLNFIKSVFTFAEENEYIKKNPVISGLIPDKKKKTRNQRSAFDDPKDLEKIFSHNIFLKWANYEASRFWLPLLGLYTGCRVEELASLYCEHVKKIEGLWCIEINDDYDRKVKNENAIRAVPLHPVLLDEFKFLEYVNKIRAQGNARVFPELKMENNKFSHSFSKKFGRYLRSKAGIKDTTKVFHSFRHNVSDHLFKKVVMESLIEELTGRAGKTETRKRYAKGYKVKTLYEECILKLNYTVDLSQLKKSNHIVN